MALESADPIIENPFGVHDHDVLCGRGAYVNGHTGNSRLRKLCSERKANFDAGNFTDKRALATEVVQTIRSLNPPGRFLKKANTKDGKTGDEPAVELIDGVWEELNDEKAIHKACQVMRDMDRKDRAFRVERKEKRKAAKEAKALKRENAVMTIAIGAPKAEEPKDAETLAAEQAAVEVVDKALANTAAVASTESVEI